MVLFERKIEGVDFIISLTNDRTHLFVSAMAHGNGVRFIEEMELLLEAHTDGTSVTDFIDECIAKLELGVKRLKNTEEE